MKLATLANNQTVIETDETVIFFSYDTEIAMYDKVTKTLSDFNMWDYSKTTVKHFKTFINNYTCFNYDSMSQWRDEITKNINICTTIKL